MARRSRSSARDIAQIATWAPWVIGLRLARFADTSPAQRHRNQSESIRMVTEKSFAVADAWYGMGLAVLKTNFDVFNALAKGSSQIASAGSRPARRRVMGNVKRLLRR